MIHDVVIIGGGIVGLTTAYELKQRDPKLSILLLEKECQVAAHQSSTNSGVIHSGIYYKKDSLKYNLVKNGVDKLLNYCSQKDISVNHTGKLIIASNKQEVTYLREIFANAKCGFLKDSIKYLGSNELKEMDPKLRGKAAIWVDKTAIVDYKEICVALLEDLNKHTNFSLLMDYNVDDIINKNDSVELISVGGVKVCGKYLISCAGYESLKLAKKSGVDVSMFKMLPFKGEYYSLEGLKLDFPVYPVPRKGLPFLGVHLTPTLSRSIEIGPTAILTSNGSSYTRGLHFLALRHLLDFRVLKLFIRFSRYGLIELRNKLIYFFIKKAVSRMYSIDSLKSKIRYKRSGIRAQLLNRDGSLVEDFVFKRSENALYVLNAPSPAATAAFAIAEEIVRKLKKKTKK